MNTLQMVKFVNVTPPAAIIDDAAAVTAAIDTVGWGKMAIVVQLGAMDIAVTECKVQESDDSGMSGAADITGLVVGTSIDPDTGIASVLPSATDDNKFVVFYIALSGRKRYIDLSLTLGNGALGTYVSVFAILTDGIDVPSSAAERGALLNLIA